MGEDELAVGRYGHAFSFCESDEDGRLWIDNEEYRSQVFYCPLCGIKAENTTKGEDPMPLLEAWAKGYATVIETSSVSMHLADENQS